MMSLLLALTMFVVVALTLGMYLQMRSLGRLCVGMNALKAALDAQPEHIRNLLLARPSPEATEPGAPPRRAFRPLRPTWRSIRKFEEAKQNTKLPAAERLAAEIQGHKIPDQLRRTPK